MTPARVTSQLGEDRNDLVEVNRQLFVAAFGLQGERCCLFRRQFLTVIVVPVRRVISPVAAMVSTVGLSVE